MLLNQISEEDEEKIDDEDDGRPGQGPLQRGEGGGGAWRGL